MGRALLAAAGVLGFTGVAMGAFGAHALRAKLTPERMTTLQTGVLYHLVHALATAAAALAAARWSSSAAAAAGWCFVAGVVLFSGSLYVLAITEHRRWGAVTPLGGVLFLVGWALLAITGIATTA
jgi:uncharacterized membrane protein YgdD (TMEM256/DUF423 family)